MDVTQPQPKMKLQTIAPQSQATTSTTLNYRNLSPYSHYISTLPVTEPRYALVDIQKSNDALLW